MIEDVTGELGLIFITEDDEGKRQKHVVKVLIPKEALFNWRFHPVREYVMASVEGKKLILKRVKKGNDDGEEKG
jgi:hypothetical protein